MTNESLYADFERQFRGNEKLIRERLGTYKPFLDFAKGSTKSLKVLDLGSGRGEWLDFTNANGYKSVGVEINGDFIKSCRARNHEIVDLDALTALKDIKESSFAIVSSFHLIEHISPQDFSELVFEAFRVLEPGGLLILETPNIENFGVSSNSFYLDPTHVRPVPLDYASFIADVAGFSVVHKLRLQENPELLEAKHITTLSDVLFGASPDCGIVAYKSNSEISTQRFSELSKLGTGINSLQLAEKFELRLNQIEQLPTREAIPVENIFLHEENKNLQTVLTEIKAHLALQQSITHEVENLKHFTNVEVSKLHEIIRNEQSTRQHLHDQLDAIITSKSWRLTAPLRWAKQLTTKVKNKIFRKNNSIGLHEERRPEKDAVALDEQAQQIMIQLNK